MFKSSGLKAKSDLWWSCQAKGCAIVEMGMHRAHAEHTYWLQQELLIILAGAPQGFQPPAIGYRVDHAW